MKRLAAIGLAMAIAAIGVRSPAHATTNRISLSLLDQTQVVDPEGQFTLHLQLGGVPPGDAEIGLTAYRAVTDRNELHSAFAGQLGKALTGRSLHFPISHFIRDSIGGFNLSLTVSAKTSEDASVLTLANAGVYPFAVALLDGSGRLVDRFITAIVRGAGLPPSHPLSVAVVVPITSSTTFGPDFHSRPIPGQPQRLSDLTDVLAAHSSPVTVVPAPDLLEMLTETEDGQATLLRFDHVGATHQVLATTYVPIEPATLVASNLASEIGLQLVTGEATAQRILPDARPDRRSWLASSFTDQPTLSHLQTLGVNQVVVPADALTPSTPADAGTRRPIELQTDHGTVPAAVVDPALVRDLTDNKPAPLVAELLSSELALVALADPDLEQGAVIVTPAAGIDPVLLSTVLYAIESNQLLAPVSLDDYFRFTRPASGPDGEPIVRTLLSARAPSLGSSGERLLGGRLQLGSVTAMLPGNDALRADLAKLLLLAARSELSTSERSSYLDAAQRLVEAVTNSVRVTDQGTVTLTSTINEVPYIITNSASTSINVSLYLSSTKLEFPGSPTKGLLVLDNVTLKPGATQQRVRVKTLARATFPMTIEVRSPDGRQILASSQLKVRSTALSGVGIALTIGAVAVLLLWWIRQTIRRRREKLKAARDQHPSGHEPAASLAEP